MNYKFNSTGLDFQSSINFSQRFDPKPFQENSKFVNYSTDFSRNHPKTFQKKNFTENQRKTAHRYTNSFEYNPITSNSNWDNQKEQTISDNVRITIEKYDFKMNFDLLKYKVDRLNQLKGKEPFHSHRKKVLSPPRKYALDPSIDWEIQSKKNELRLKSQKISGILAQNKKETTFVSSRKTTDEVYFPKSFLRESENCVQQLSTVQYINHSSSGSEINLDEITDNLINYKNGVEEEENNKKNILRKLLFIDDNYEKKNDIVDFSNTLVLTPKDKPDSSALEISDLKCERMNSKKLQQISEIKPIPEERSEELLKSQNLIEGLKGTDYVTLYERNNKEEIINNEKTNIELNDNFVGYNPCDNNNLKKEKNLIDNEDIVVIEIDEAQGKNNKYGIGKEILNEQINIQIFSNEKEYNKPENGERNEIEENKQDTLDADEHLSELSQFLKDAGLITETKFKEDESPIKEADVKIQNLVPLPSSVISINHINNFEIPSRQSVTPASFTKEFRSNTADLNDKPLYIIDNVSVNEMGNSSLMTNGSKKKVTFSENKVVINYEMKRFASLVSPSGFSTKKKSLKKPKSILIKKANEEDTTQALEKLNNLIKECEDDPDTHQRSCNSLNINSNSKINTSNSHNAINVKSLLNSSITKTKLNDSFKFISKNKQMVKEMEERLKRGEPIIKRRSPAPKTAKRNSFCTKFKRNPYKFYSENPSVNHISYELNIKKDSELMKNLNRAENMSPVPSIHRKCNSSNFLTIASLKKIDDTKELSVISDRSHESSCEKNKAANRYKKNSL